MIYAIDPHMFVGGFALVIFALLLNIPGLIQALQRRDDDDD